MPKDFLDVIPGPFETQSLPHLFLLVRVIIHPRRVVLVAFYPTVHQNSNYPACQQPSATVLSLRQIGRPYTQFHLES